ncbi:MAG: hypothetical protein IJ344_04065 [Clostridia bacterium]|nr:hypothetical protein [Clostridia bacterium]
MAALVLSVALLSGCATPLLNSNLPLEQQSPAPSASLFEESPEESSEEEPLPAQYFTKNGWLLLDIQCEANPTLPGVWVPLPPAFEPAITPEALKEKLMAVRFTEEELEILAWKDSKNGCVQMIDPRLLAPFSIPSGLILKETQYISSWSTGVWFSFYYESDGSFEDGRTFRAEICYDSGVGGQGQLRRDTFMKLDGNKIVLEDGTQAVCRDGPSGRDGRYEQLRYVKEQNGRVYYVEQTRRFDDDGVERLEAGEIVVFTMHKGHQFEYSVKAPSQELREHILDFDPFTYL